MESRGKTPSVCAGGIRTSTPKDATRKQQGVIRSISISHAKPAGASRNIGIEFPPDRHSARFLRLPLDTVILQVVQPSHAETSQSETERNENPLRALGEEESPGCAEENPLPGGPQVTAHGFGCEEEGLDE